MSAGSTALRVCRSLFDKLVDPLRADDSMTNFTLSIPEAQTTTVDSVQGWRNRPPAVLRCPGCETPILQRRSTHRIDCPYCYRDFPDSEFGDHELIALICPRCEHEMDYGRRHPKLFDVPEWATCTSCHYHWDLNHWF